MSKFKDFTGKTLDDAIEKALSSYGVSRENLELEIVSGGSSGIFGLMGRKAVVRARLRTRQTESALVEAQPETVAPEIETPPTATPQPTPKPPRTEQPEPKAAPITAIPPKTAETAPRGKGRPASGRGQGGRARNGPSNGDNAPRRDERPARPERTERPRSLDAANDDYDERSIYRAPRVAPEDEPDIETLNAVVREVVVNILTPIIGPAELEITNEPGRVKVLILDEDNSGLIIGREGQTITSLQYIVNRIVARKLLTSTRVHLDAGDYRQRQDENLQRMALYLADKAKNQNRTQSTKPLSSYHRRLVHLALQDDEAIVTSSKGDGPLKRVLIHPRRSNGGAQSRA